MSVDDEPPTTATVALPAEATATPPPDQQSDPASATRRSDWHDLSPLLTFVDVVYGAALGYIFVQIAEGLRVWFHPSAAPHIGSPVPEADLFVQGGLALLVLNYLIHDYAEARLVTHRYPYQGHQRFLIDLAIAALFLLVFIGAEEGSAYLFVPLAFVFIFGAWWALVVEAECGRAALYPYPQFVVLTHLAAAVMSGAYVGYRQYIGTMQLNANDVLWIWCGYAVWVAVVMFFKWHLRLPATHIDLLPVGVIGKLCTRCWRLASTSTAKVGRWLRRP